MTSSGDPFGGRQKYTAGSAQQLGTEETFKGVMKAAGLEKRDSGYRVNT